MSKVKNAPVETTEVEMMPRRLFDWADFPAFGRWLDTIRPAMFAGVELRVEEKMVDGNLVVRIEAPGINPDKDCEITVRDGMLHVTAERRQEERTEEEGWFRSEFRYGSFHRSISLPAGASAEDVKATYHDGIVELVIPVSKESPTQKVAIQRG